MIQHRTNPDNIIQLGGDIYRLQRRPQHQEVVINDRYQGVLAVNIWTGKREIQVPFGQGYDSSGFIDAWCFRDDGNAVIVMHEEGRYASWLSLDPGKQSYEIEAARFDRLFNLRYLWHGDLFLIGKRFGEARYTLQAEQGHPVFMEVTLAEALTLSPDWLCVQSGVSSHGHTVERIMPEESRLVWHRFQPPERVGVLDCTSRLIWSAPIDGDVARLAFLGDVMFILQEYEAHAIDRVGAIRCVYHAPPGYYFTDLDTIPTHRGYPPAVAIACNAINPSYDDSIAVFAIEASMLADAGEGWHPMGT